MSAPPYIVWIYLISTIFATRYWHHSPRLIQQHDKHHHHPYYSAKKSKYSDYDRLLEQQEINELYDNAENGYDNYYDEYFDEMVGAANLIEANSISEQGGGDPNHHLFRVNTGCDPPYIQVHYPTRMNPGPPVYGAWKIFDWHTYEKEVDKGIMTSQQVKSVYDDNSLRKRTEMGLLKDSAIALQVKGWRATASFTEDCLADLGSKTAKSDLDFTFIYWPEPNKVVPSMVKFYNKFHSFYGEWPLKVYDMNFYIAAGFTKQSCYDSWPAVGDARTDRIRLLFTVINDARGNIYELGNKAAYKQPIYWKVDMYMSYLFVKRRLDLKTLDEKKGDAKLKALTRYSVVFYWFLDKIKDGVVDITADPDYDDAVIFLKTLLYAMNYWSDESYVTNSALQLIFKKGVAAMPNMAKFLAVLDCTAFIKRYYQESIDEGKDDLWWFNKVSKYMMRNGKLLQSTRDFTHHEAAKKTSHFPETVYNYLRGDKGAKVNFDEDKLGLSSYEINYFALAEQWSGEWDGQDGRAAVGAVPRLKKIRGDVPLDYISGTNDDKPIWTNAYQIRYEAWQAYQKDGNKKHLTDRGCANEQAMLAELEYAPGKRHASFVGGKYAAMGPMFFRARKIWDYMKKSKRHFDKKLVMDLLNKMTANVIQYNIKSQFKEKKKVDVVQKIFTDIMKDAGGDIPKWVEAKIKKTDRNPPLNNPPTKVLSFKIKTGAKDVAVMENLRAKSQLNPFKGTDVRKTLTS